MHEVNCVSTQLLNMLYSHQLHTAAIYISVCVMWHKGTSVYISYCQLQQVTQPHCNMLHSYQQHTAAIYITVCVMWHKGTSVYISYCQLQQVTQPQFKPNYQFILTVCTAGHGITGQSVQWQPIYRREFIITNLLTGMLTKYSSKWINGWPTE